MAGTHRRPGRDPIIYEFDVVRTERTHNPRLLEKIAREGVPIYPEEDLP